MTDLELLRQKLVEVKDELESEGKVLGEKEISNTDDLMEALPVMKEYEYRFQDAIEEIWPDKVWWQMTHYWDIFQNSIMQGKKADDVIEDIMSHIVIEESLDEGVTECKPSDSVLDIMNKLSNFED